MSGLYLWNGIAWIQTPETPSVSDSKVIADTDKATITGLDQPVTPAKASAAFTLRSTVTSGGVYQAAGQVRFERQLSGSSTWTSLGTDTASTSNAWTLATTHPAALGTHKYRALYLGSGVYQPSTSAIRSVVMQANAVTTTINLYATASRSYEEDGSYRYEYHDSRMYHGYYSSTNGQQKSACWFSVPANVKGSTVTAVKIRLTRIGSLGDSSVSIYGGTHTDASVSSTWSGISGKHPADTFTGDSWSSSDNTTTYTLDDTVRADFAAGAKGLTFGPSSGSYCAFHGVAGVSSGEKPYLTITYTYQP